MIRNIEPTLEQSVEVRSYLVRGEVCKLVLPEVEGVDASLGLEVAMWGLKEPTQSNKTSLVKH